MIFIGQVAQGVGDALDGVGLTVGEIVHGVDAPGVAGAMVGGVDDAVHDRVAQVDIARSHVDLGAQDAGALGKFALAHAGEQVQVLLHAAVPEGAFGAGLGEGAAVFTNLVSAQVIHIGFAFTDEPDGEVIELLKVIGGVQLCPLPVKAQPADIFFLRIDVFHIFFDRVGVIEAQVGLAAKSLGGLKIDADGFGMTDVQVAVGFGGEAGVHMVKATGAQVFGDCFEDEVGGGGGGFVRHGVLFLRRKHPGEWAGCLLKKAGGRGFEPL